MIKVSVYLSVSISPELQIQPLLFFVHVTYGRMARSSFGGVVICYVLPVLWMTSCLHIKDVSIALWLVTTLRRAQDNAPVA